MRLPRNLPAPHADDLDWLVFEQSGVLTSTQATEHLGRSGLRRRIDRGQWRRICTGIVSTSNGPLTAEQTLWVAVLLAGSTAVLGGLTAAREEVRGSRAVRVRSRYWSTVTGSIRIYVVGCPSTCRPCWSGGPR
ncbi:hypothetical protein [Micromonospora sp. LOL_021]|uniref:hypothetical protein n=1 Tax=Micromonospora sp. LOL_021 TaxID=3345417 RepID=UPI003A8A6134